MHMFTDTFEHIRFYLFASSFSTFQSGSVRLIKLLSAR